MAETELITLILLQGTGSIWNLKDWSSARHHKIIGNFIGNLAQQPYQVKEKGLPLLLTKNETTLLLEKNLAVLRTSTKISDCPDIKHLDRYNKKRYDSFSKQNVLLRKEREKEILSKSELIITGKIKKRQKLDPEYIMQEEERELIIQDEISKISDPSQSHMLIEIPTEDPWMNKINWETSEWLYPETEEEELEYSTFRSLWEKDYWVTPGSKFGGDFLVYCGDPLQFHSSYIVRCKKNDQLIHLHELITLARLATSTNKVPVLAYFDSNKKIKFQSVSWVN